jgi:ABC-2 type transport system permease protein
LNGRTLRILGGQVLVEQRIFWRNVSASFFTFVLPLVMLAVISLSPNATQNVGMIIALGVLSASFQGLAIQLAMHRDQGVLKGLMATPLTPGMLIAGKVVSLLVVVMLEAAIVLAFGVWVLGADAPHSWLLLVGFVVLGTVAFTAIAFAVASIIPTSDSAPAIVNAVYLGLILGSVLLQIEELPAFAHAIGDALPLVHLFEAIRDAWLDGAGSEHAISALVLCAWGIVAALWTVRRFRWEPTERA